MKLNALISAAALAFAAPAFAVGPGDLGALDNTSATVGQVVGSGLFVDTYTFSLTDPGMVFGGDGELKIQLESTGVPLAALPAAHPAVLHAAARRGRDRPGPRRRAG